jgi:hypothetical protein
MPFAVGLVLVIPESIQKAEVGARQQLSSGIVSAYDPSNHNMCSYTFTVAGRQFAGKSGAPTDTAYVGEQVQVYYDPIKPSTNSLEDFRQASWEDRAVAYVLLIGIGLVVAIVLYAKARKSRQ